MPQVTWETIIGALALVALVAGAQYVRTSSHAAVHKSVEEAKTAVKSASKKKQKKKAAQDGPATTSSSEGSYAEVAQAAVEEVKQDVVEPVQAAVKKTKKKKSKPSKAVESDRDQPAPEPTTNAPAPDTSNDASLAAALSAEEQEHTTTAPEDTSESEAETIPVVAQRKTVGEWEKPKKVVGGGGAEKVASGWESAPARATITSTNRFSALSLSSAAPSHAKKPLPRTSASGTGKHRVHHDDEPGSASATKLQKKNAAQAAAKKAAKEAEERDRLERLARYRREQEKEKIAALYAKPKQSSKGVSVAANNRSLSNGMNASVDLGGKLVWD